MSQSYSGTINTSAPAPYISTLARPGPGPMRGQNWFAKNGHDSIPGLVTLSWLAPAGYSRPVAALLINATARQTNIRRYHVLDYPKPETRDAWGLIANEQRCEIELPYQTGGTDETLIIPLSTYQRRPLGQGDREWIETREYFQSKDLRITRDPTTGAPTHVGFLQPDVPRSESQAWMINYPIVDTGWTGFKLLSDQGEEMQGAEGDWRAVDDLAWFQSEHGAVSGASLDGPKTWCEMWAERRSAA